MGKRRRICLFIFSTIIAATLFLGLPAFAQTGPNNTAPVVNAGANQTATLSSAADPKISANTCGTQAFSRSTADPFTTTFPVTVKPGDSLLSMVDGYRAVGKTISSVVFNGAESLSRSITRLGNTMGAEVWSLKNPTATTANIVITYTTGGTFVFDQACARTFSGVDWPPQSTAAFTTADASSGITLTGLASTIDKAVFVDVASCNCGALIMTPEANRTLGLNAGPNQVGSSVIITKSPAGTDTMPWTAPAVPATEVGVVYAPLSNRASANLSGTATDDGLPNGTLQITWSAIGGPAGVTFSNANVLNTTVTFSATGRYTLRLTASDGVLSSTSDLTVVVDTSNAAAVVSAGQGQTITLSRGDPKLSASTCTSPASSTSVADPFITTFPVTVKPGDTLLSVVDGYRSVGKTISSIVFNGSENLTKSAGTLGNTMGAEIWSLNNPTATTANIVITYTTGGTFVFDRACARTFSGLSLPAQSTAVFTTANAPGGIQLTGLSSTVDKSVFIDVAACNCGSLIMTPESSRTLDLNAGPNQVGSSTIITKSPAGTDTMPWTTPAAQATQAGAVYPSLSSGAVATLSATASDDGFPNGVFQTIWSVISGPGAVTFGNANSLSTTATFTTAGTYTLRLTASDGVLSSTSDVTIVVNPATANAPPIVNAGAGQTITLTSVSDTKLSTTTCAVPAFSVSTAEPFTTTFPVTVKPGDTVLSVIDGYRAIGKTISTVVFNGSEYLTKSVGMLGNTMGAEIWSLKNPSATTANIVISYTNGGTFVFDSACARTFSGIDAPLQPGAVFTTANASTGFSLTGLISTSDKAIFVDAATCNCGGLTMTAEPNRTLGLNAGPNQVGSSTVIGKSPAGNDAMPWTAPPVQATEVGVVYPPLPGGTAILSGTVADDGLPSGAIQTTWSEVSGPGAVTFSNAAALSTTATFSTAGTYVLRLTASDTALSSTSDVTVIVNQSSNAAPIVSAGTDQTITFPATANLFGNVTDDGLPNGTVQTTWSEVSGPGTVTFGNASALNTTATFSTMGTYVLRLTASDTALSSSSDMTIFVNPTATSNSMFVMSTALALQGQSNWFFYNAGDAPQGAYMGWLFQGTTLTGTVRLPQQLPPGRYYIFFNGASYDSNETIKVTMGGGTSTSVMLNDRDATKYWSDRVVVDSAATSDLLQIQLTRDPAITADQRFLFLGMYITDRADETVTWDGLAVRLVYPTVMNNSAPVKGNLVPNGGFEIPIDASWGFAGQGAGRTVPINTMWDSSEGYEGQGCLKLTFDVATNITPNNLNVEFISRVYHLKPNKKYTLSMWMKASPGMTGTATISLVNTYVPPAGYPGQYLISGSQLVTDTWSRVTVTGYLLEYPTSDYQIHVTMPGPSGTYVLIDGVQLEEGDLTSYAPATQVEAGLFIDMAVKPANIFYTDDVLQADMVARNNTAASLTKTLRYEIYDYLNRIVAQGSLGLTLPPLTTQRLPFNLSPAGQQGIFRLVTWIDNSDRTEREVVYSILPRPLTTAADPASSLGITAYYADTQLKMLQRMGIKWSRSASPAVCRWTDAEPMRGGFVWNDLYVQLANSYGISTMCTIGANQDWPVWADNGGLPDLVEWQNFVGQLVSHYKPLIKTWEIWNEAYAVFPPSYYSQMLKVAADAIENADPTATIVGMGGSPPDFIQAVITVLETQYPDWNWRQHIDVLATHDYPDGIAPESLKPLIDKYGVPVWNTEAGSWDLGFYQGVNSNFVSWGKSPWPHTDGARYYVGTIGALSAFTENYLRTIGTGQSKYFYYDSRYYASPDFFVHNQTLLEYDGTIRSKGISYAIAGSLIDHSVGMGNVSPDPNSFFLIFDKAGGAVAALFTADNNPQQVTINLSAAQFQVLDVMGNPQSMGSTIRYGRIPVYIKGAGINAATLKAALQAGVITAVADTTPPNLSLSDAPRGAITDHDFRVRWIAVDDTSYPNLGEINPVTNASISPNPNAILYSYILNGYSSSWSDWSPETYAEFSNVPSGSYTFSVIAKDTAGNQSAVLSRSIVIN